MKRIATGMAVGLVTVFALSGGAQQKPVDWPAVAGDVGAMKYSPADQITPANVNTLKEAWTYQTGGPAPIVIGSVMYFAAGANVVALNGETGAEVWKFAL